jgi:cell division protein FtsB|tara:strand:- start:108 stop:452 length:345 start_codon:yes stop_codon:yes gene_type:complete
LHLLPDKRHETEADTVSIRKPPAMGVLIYFAITFALGLYFTFAAVQGDFGLFRRAEIEAETRALEARLEALESQVARMENLTRRLSDSYLDLDLLDQQARDVLGLMRSDEIVIR